MWRKPTTETMRSKNGKVPRERQVDGCVVESRLMLKWGLRRYRAMESAATRLQKEAKGYLDSLRGETS